jgi:hypothetical protein
MWVWQDPKLSVYNHGSLRLCLVDLSLLLHTLPFLFLDNPILLTLFLLRNP